MLPGGRHSAKVVTVEGFINVMVVLHLVGMAAIVGGWFAYRFGAKALAPIVWGARAQLVTGLILVGLNEANKDPLNHVKIAVKLVVAIAVAACAEIARARSKRGEEAGQLVDAAGVLAIVNTAIAVLWVTDSASA